MLLRLLIVLVAAAVFNTRFCHGRNDVANLAERHFQRQGVRLPTADFLAALRATAVDISSGNCRRSLVMMGMVNDDALLHTVPLFLKSLSRVESSVGRAVGQTLDSLLVLVAWSAEALSSCLALKATYRHQCVRDLDHKTGHGSFAFHSSSFNAFGFARIKYILNALSAGYDVLFLDTDIVVLQDPLPHLLTRGGDMYGLVEKCQMVNDTQPLRPGEFSNPGVKRPWMNIGLLYFKATAAVTRCVYNWIWDMYGQVSYRPRVWEQDIYNVMMAKCAGPHGIRWQVLDPRVFQSACYKACGCTYNDTDLLSNPYGTYGGAIDPINGTRKCEPAAWSHWILRHFACSGNITDKAGHMRNLVDGLLRNEPADITYRWK